MVKADRYTEDGCEAITKAREADVEDRIYQIGEISQKTGLQKTAEGWVTPKGKGQNAAIEAKAFAEKEYGGNNSVGAKYEVTEMASGKIYDTPDKNFRIIERNHNGKKTYDIRNRKDSQSEDIKDIKSLEEAKSIVEKKQKVAEGTKKNSLENAKKMAESYRKTSNKPIYITEKDGDYVVAKGRDELEYARENGYKLVPSTPYPNRKLVSKISSNEDSAPRQLTGDCKITIKG